LSKGDVGVHAGVSPKRTLDDAGKTGCEATVDCLAFDVKASDVVGEKLLGVVW
jgi:hypothetical protein